MERIRLQILSLLPSQTVSAFRHLHHTPEAVLISQPIPSFLKVSGFRKKQLKARALTAFNRVVAAAKHLMDVVLKNEGLANKDLAKFESQIQNLADKWDRDDR